MVITGRSTDTALTMAPLRHEFGWGATDWDRLAAGIIAGHIIECGAQASGGNCMHDWRNIPDLADVGYPIVEARADGTFVVTKHPNTGGRVSVPSVTEQLVYEMGDPRRYLGPDCTADFTSARIDEVDSRVGAFVTVAIAVLGSVVSLRAIRTNVREVMQDGSARSGLRRGGRIARLHYHLTWSTRGKAPVLEPTVVGPQWYGDVEDLKRRLRLVSVFGGSRLQIAGPTGAFIVVVFGGVPSVVLVESLNSRCTDSGSAA